MGGLFRHVLDLATEQSKSGHEVGLVADAVSSDALTRHKLDDIAPAMALGVHLLTMSRKPGLGDVSAARGVVSLAKRLNANIVHGHGAKGGAYARIAARFLKLGGLDIRCFYTPHGGSLHFSPGTVEGRIYLTLERLLTRATDGIIFESTFAHDVYRDRIGLRGRPVRIVPNGLREEDFEPHRPKEGAADFLFVGELRHLKGVDVLLHALAAVNQTHPARARIVGGGPDHTTFESLAANLGLTSIIDFPGAKPAQSEFANGRCLIVPSRAESFPYIVLEAGATAMPIIVTQVGGIPEMTAKTPVALIKPDDVKALQTEMIRFLEQPESFYAAANAFKTKVEATYRVKNMADAISHFYAEPAATTA